MTAAELTYQREYRARTREQNRDRLNANKRAYNAKRIADGICRSCKTPVLPGMVVCAVHREMNCARGRKYRALDPEKHKGRTNKWRAANKDKARDQQLRRCYGIGSAEVNAMLAAQDGRCPICGTDAPDTKTGWHVDHDHATGKVRGVLCHKCNMGIGALRDDPSILRAAVAYLERHQ